MVIKCTPEEKAQIQKKAKKLGMGISAYVRMLALEDSKSDER